jgi:hypothetical protein
MGLAKRVGYLGTGPLAGFGGSRAAALAHARQRLEYLSMPAIGRHRTMASSSLSVWWSTSPVTLSSCVNLRQLVCEAKALSLPAAADNTR